MEVTISSKPSMEKGPYSGSASGQAVTRVNAEQASKDLMWEPTQREDGEGRRQDTQRTTPVFWSRRGNGDGMPIHGSVAQHCKTQRWRRVTAHWTPPRG